MEHLLDEMSLAKPATLHRAPVKGAWTPLQTLHHLQLAERGSVDYLLYKFGQGGTPPRLSPKQRVTGKFVALALMSPFKFSAPEQTNSSKKGPSSKLDLEQTAYAIRGTRAELENFLRTVSDDWHRGAAYRHPTGGRMSLKDMLRFFRAHQDRHGKQIKRALAQNARYYRRQEAG